MKSRNIIFFAIAILIVITFFVSEARAATTSSFTGISSISSYSQYQYRPSFQTYYGSNVQTYWPILGDKATCEARQDLLLNVAPAGCQPMVVRSDLLADQNVPVFCQIDALKINPLIDISQIRNIVFRGKYPPEIVGAGFHPAQAALRTQDKLLGKPLINNIGYVVLVLRRQPVESKLPDVVNVTLEAEIEYISGNVYGVGSADFALEPVTDAEWASRKYKQSFWNGRYFVRLERADANFADVSIYEGIRKINTVRVEKGKVSNKFFMPGMYCRAGLQVAYDDYIIAKDKATIEVSSDLGTDVFDVYDGSKFLDGRCNIKTVKIDDNGETGKVTGSCQGKNFELKLTAIGNNTYNVFLVNGKTKEPEVSDDGSYKIELTELKETGRKGIYYLENTDELTKVPTGKSAKKEGFIAVNSSGAVNNSITKGDIDWILQLWNAMKDYRNKKTKDSSYSIGELKNKDIKEAKTYYELATQNYEKVADDFPSEKKADIEDAFYGEEALRNAIQLSKDAGAKKDEARLINKYLELYDNSSFAEGFKQELNNLYKIDSSNAAEVVVFDDRARMIRVVSFSKPQKEAKATFLVGGKRFVIGINKSIDISENNKPSVGYMKIESLKVDRVDVKAVCDKNNNARRYSFAVDGKTQQVCDVINVELTDIDAGQSARIRLLPYAEGTQTRTNVTVGVGIEKRLIKLSPDKALEKIENLNESIKKWEKISASLGKVVTGLKGACFATSAMLTFKNFMTGLNGETLARQQVMPTWKVECEKMVADGKYPNLNACYLGESNNIDSDVARTTASINSINAKIQQIQGKHVTSSGIFGKSVDANAVRKELAAEARDKYKGRTIKLKDNREITVEELLSEENVNNGVVTTDDIRSVMLYSELEGKQGVSEPYTKSFDDKFTQIAERVNENNAINEAVNKAKDYEKKGLPAPFDARSEHGETRYASVKTIPSTITLPSKDEKVKQISMVSVPTSQVDKQKFPEAKANNFEGGLYILGLDKGNDVRNPEFSIPQIWRENSNGNYELMAKENVSVFLGTYKIGNIRSVEEVGYSNEIAQKDRVVRYYETEPYKGMPAIVPFDLKNGWYAATKQTLPVFGGIGAFDASGRVTSFWLCNVGKNGRIEFETGLGDDLCQQINLNTGQPLGVFPGLNEQQARDKIAKAQKAIEDAANQYGNKKVKILGQPFEVGQPATGKPGTQCQDFMSPKDCLLLFNVCDPVICPASRCDFGGTFPVANVPQTGIIGSIMLCLPNIREGIAVPVCLTGIQAGIDSFISIMRNYRDCLQENVNTGRMVGICDQIYSIYLCDFFWNQVAPFVDVLIPKLIEVAYGQGARGGGEYLTIQSAWQNMQNSINYFTQSYAVNSMQAFQVRSQGQFGNPLSTNNAVAEIGTTFCKGFISAKAPAAFKSLIKPDSPPQFYAWFDSTRYSDATVPATARYKVFYHIFAGKDSGIYFDVYLKNPPESSYYSTAPYVPVASSYIPMGEYASDTKDFTAPEGYKELCVRVNAQEECGFKQVTTDFAVNYLRDEYVKDQMTKDVTSEKECVGGTPSAYPMLNPNLQSGVQETISPQIYNRGVIRICSTENPGKGVNEERFVNVGYCDDKKISCWLDKNSVSNAITKNNLGVQNETLQALEQRMFNMLADNGTLLQIEQAVASLQEIDDRISEISKKYDKTKAERILTDANNLDGKLFYNSHKAWLLLLKGRTYDIMTRDALVNVDSRIRTERDKQTAAGGTSGTGAGGSSTGEGASSGQLGKIAEDNYAIIKGQFVYYDETGRLKVDFGGSTGSYGLNVTNNLEFWNGKNWISADNKNDDWTTKLKNDLNEFKSKNPYHSFKSLSGIPLIFNGQEPRFESPSERFIVEFNGQQFSINVDNILQYYNNGWYVMDEWQSDKDGKGWWREELRQALIDWKNEQQGTGGGAQGGGAGGTTGESLPSVFGGNTPKKEGDRWVVYTSENELYGINASDDLEYSNDNGINWIVPQNWKDAEWRRNLKKALIEYKNDNSKISQIFEGGLPNEAAEDNSEGKRWIIGFGEKRSDRIYGLNSKNELEFYNKVQWEIPSNWKDEDAAIDWRAQIRQKLIKYKEMKAKQSSVQITEECKITDAFWSQFGSKINNIEAGEQAQMKIEAASACQGKQVKFTIYENKLFARDVVGPSADEFVEEKTTSDWTTEAGCRFSVLGACLNKEAKYYFIAKIGDETKASDDLRVTKKTEEGASGTGGGETGDGKTGGGNGGTQVELQNYSLRTEYSAEKKQNVQMIYLGENDKTGIYFLVGYVSGAIYVELPERADILIGAVTTAGRINIPDAKIEEAKPFITNTATIEHLRFLNGKEYSKLSDGTLQCIVSEVSSCGAGQVREIK